MIILEFRQMENLEAASKILGASGLPFQPEIASEVWQSSFIYFFEDDLCTERQREALGRARILEKLDNEQKRHHTALNLALPS